MAVSEKQLVSTYCLIKERIIPPLPYKFTLEALITKPLMFSAPHTERLISLKATD